MPMSATGEGTESYYEGKPCPTCGSLLVAVEANPTAIQNDETGKPLNSCTYECGADPPHSFRDFIDLQQAAAPLRRITMRLIPKREDEAGPPPPDPHRDR